MHRCTPPSLRCAAAAPNARAVQEAGSRGTHTCSCICCLMPFVSAVESSLQLGWGRVACRVPSLLWRAGHAAPRHSSLKLLSPAAVGVCRRCISWTAGALRSSFGSSAAPTCRSAPRSCLTLSAGGLCKSALQAPCLACSVPSFLLWASAFAALFISRDLACERCSPALLAFPCRLAALGQCMSWHTC